MLPLWLPPRPPIVLGDTPLHHLAPGLEWPRLDDYTIAGTHFGFWSDQGQGIAGDGASWFISQTTRIFKAPLSVDIGGGAWQSADGVISVGVDVVGDGYNHFGDVDCYADRLYVTVEKADAFDVAPKIAVFDARDLAYLGSDELRGHDGHAPWCAVNPLTGLVFSSNSDGVTSLHVHAVHVGGRVHAMHVRDLPLLRFEGPFGTSLPVPLDGLQGGAFSPLGHLYLAVHGGGGGAAGIYRFDSLTGDRDADGRWLGRIPIDFGDFEEVEGIAFLPFPPRVAPGVTGSDLHLLIVDGRSALIQHIAVPARARGRV